MKTRELIMMVITTVLVLVLLPIIGKIALILLAVAAVYMIYIYFKSKSLRREIEQNPEQYFARQQREKEYAQPRDVIDAEYTEREVKEEHND